MPVRKKPKRADYLSFDALTLEAICNRYGIAYANVRYFSPILVRENECLLVDSKSETARKAFIYLDDESLFLKEVPWYCRTEELMSAKYEFVDFLTRREFPCAQLVSTIDGSPNVDMGDFAFELWKVVPGASYAYRPEEQYSAGKTLGNLHVLSSQFPVTREPESVPQLALGFIDLVRSARGDSRFFVHELASLEAKTRTICSELQLPASTMDQVITVHGNYTPWNLAFKDGEVVGVFDFDNVAVDSPMHDVAEGLLGFCAMNYEGTSTNFAAEPPRSFNWNGVERFIAGYATVRDLAADDLRILRGYLKLVWIEFACLGMVRGDYGLEVLDQIEDLMLDIDRGTL